MNGIINRLGTVLKDTDVDLSLDNIITVVYCGDNNTVATNTWTQGVLPNNYYALCIATRADKNSGENYKEFIVKEFQITDESTGASREIFTINSQTVPSILQLRIFHSNNIGRTFSCTYQAHSSGRVLYHGFLIVFLKS